jgi:hypothetical protein
MDKWAYQVVPRTEAQVPHRDQPIFDMSKTKCLKLLSLM